MNDLLNPNFLFAYLRDDLTSILREFAVLNEESFCTALVKNKTVVSLNHNIILPNYYAVNTDHLKIKDRYCSQLKNILQSIFLVKSYCITFDVKQEVGCFPQLQINIKF